MRAVLARPSVRRLVQVALPRPAPETAERVEQSGSRVEQAERALVVRMALAELSASLPGPRVVQVRPLATFRSIAERLVLGRLAQLRLAGPTLERSLWDVAVKP
jgi:hypothetical protein